VLDVFASRVDLMVETPFEPLDTGFSPVLGLRMVGQGQPGGVERGGFGQQVIVVLGAGIGQGWDDSAGLLAD
jgi:hypothetical protein